MNERAGAASDLQRLSRRELLELLVGDEKAARPLSRAAVYELARRAERDDDEHAALDDAVIEQRRRNAQSRDTFIAEFPVVGGVLRALGDRLSPWQIALWWTAANGWLDGQRPADLARTEPEQVIRAAQRLADELGPVRVEVVSAWPRRLEPLDWDF